MENTDQTRKRIKILLLRLQEDLGDKEFKQSLGLQADKHSPSLYRWTRGTTLISEPYQAKLAGLLGVSRDLLERYAAGEKTVIDFYLESDSPLVAWKDRYVKHSPKKNLNSIYEAIDSLDPREAMLVAERAMRVAREKTTDFRLSTTATIAVASLLKISLKAKGFKDVSEAMASTRHPEYGFIAWALTRLMEGNNTSAFDLSPSHWGFLCLRVITNTAVT